MIESALTDHQIGEKYQIKNNRDWSIADARETLRKREDWEAGVIRCSYRPFDDPYCYFGQEFMDYPRRELLDHVAWRENIQILVSRQIGIAEWRHIFVADQPAESCCISDGTTEQNYCFPLYLYGQNHESRVENLSPTFREWLDKKYQQHISPEEVIGYTYAVLHAPTFRARYAEFLRIDFPRIPFPETKGDFDALSKLGWALLQAHLLRRFPRHGLAQYGGKGNHVVEAVRYDPEQGVWINETQLFVPVPQAVWDFQIGGYQVIDKYLKSRKGRKLSLDEINHVAAVADALAFTIEQMAKIDEAYLTAFPERG
jgi:predicted helicase